jgi:tetratricopeptide (TPR) repeat protein
VLLNVAGADLAEAKVWLQKGDYTNCLATAEKALRETPNDEEWPVLQLQVLLATGRYPEAFQVATNTLAKDLRSLPFRWLARETFLRNGDTNRAERVTEEMRQLAINRSWAYREPRDTVIFGHIALLMGAEPKKVLEGLYDIAKKAEPNLREAYLAIGELALEKHDYALAAKTFEEGLKNLPNDPDLHHGRARAFVTGNRAEMVTSLAAALDLNTNHVPSLLLMADHAIDGEEYTMAEKLLSQIVQVNPWHPEAWAYRTILAYVTHQPEEARVCRDNALKFWKTNPRVDHLIGAKLSQKYRFDDGAASQRRALLMDKNFLPAKAQLANDLLRLGEEDEGWRLAEEVQTQDGYDVAAYNLVTLRETMAKFTTLTNRDFIVRMSATESPIYGERALSLLSRARSNLCALYGIDLPHATIVEIFPEQKDFGVRTFGMPDNPGFLGVCFGRVITANSPAANSGRPVNWEAVLWHEFTHVVTLQMTHNKMPRWLSEGISVYEERRTNPAWGEKLTPVYREMILQDQLWPIAKLSSAFLTPKSMVHLQFAYYESSLVVEFIVQHHGMESLKAILKDLREGVKINDAITRHTLAMDKLEKDFAEYAQQQARQLAPGLDWSKPDAKKDPLKMITLEDVKTDETKKAATNYWSLLNLAQTALDDKKWPEAKPLLEKLVELYPNSSGPDSAYRLLGTVYHELNDTNREWQVLKRLAELDAEAPDVYLRLMELAAVRKDYSAMHQNALRFIAVNPLTATPYRYLAQADEQLKQDTQAVEAYQTLLKLDPPNPAEVHFQLAKVMHRTANPAAKREVLKALEEAPRYREALKFLLEIQPSKEPEAPDRTPTFRTRSQDTKP